ncbi:hypothetical protein D3C81_1479500 [compost metagenome]
MEVPDLLDIDGATGRRGGAGSVRMITENMSHRGVGKPYQGVAALSDPVESQPLPDFRHVRLPESRICQHLGEQLHHAGAYRGQAQAAECDDGTVIGDPSAEDGPVPGQLLGKLCCIELPGPLVEAVQGNCSQAWVGTVKHVAGTKAQGQVEHRAVMVCDEADLCAAGGLPTLGGGLQGRYLAELDFLGRFQVGHGLQGGVGSWAVAQRWSGGRQFVWAHAGTPGRR